jgi:hypothetical protein
MRIGRAIIFPTILALGAAGSILTASAASASTVQAPNVHAHPTVLHAGTHLLYHT